MSQAQDWKQVILHAPKSSNVKNKEIPSTQHKNDKTLQSALDSTEAGSHEKVSLSLAKQIQQARLAKGLSQKDLANSINEQASVIQSYESGKAQPNSQILQKLRKSLNIQLKK